MSSVLSIPNPAMELSISEDEFMYYVSSEDEDKGYTTDELSEEDKGHTTDEISEEDPELSEDKYKDYITEEIDSITQLETYLKLKGSTQSWKKLKESSVEEMSSMPLAVQVPVDVYYTSYKFIKQCTDESLESFVLLALESLIRSLKAEEVVEHVDDQLLVLAMVLRCKPAVLISVLPKLKEDAAQANIIVLAWVMTQVWLKEYDLGMFLWVRYLLPLLCCKSNVGLESKVMIVEAFFRIRGDCKPHYFIRKAPRALMGNELVVPPEMLEQCVKTAFSGTEGAFKKVYEEQVYVKLRDVVRIVKKYALNFRPNSENAKIISERLIPFTLKAAGEGNIRLAREASAIFIWCLTNNCGSYKQWDNIYLENLIGSNFMLKKLSLGYGWRWRKMVRRNHFILGPLMSTMKSVVSKSERAWASEHDVARKDALKTAQELALKIVEPVIDFEWQSVESDGQHGQPGK